MISDTDSIGLGLTKSEKFDPNSRKEMMEALFYPIVQKGKLDEFKSKLGKYLVLSNEIEDEKVPGKLKEEFQTIKGEMIALCPKTYFAHCLDSKSKKDQIDQKEQRKKKYEAHEKEKRKKEYESQGKEKRKKLYEEKEKEKMKNEYKETGKGIKTENCSWKNKI